MWMPVCTEARRQKPQMHRQTQKSFQPKMTDRSYGIHGAYRDFLRFRFRGLAKAFIDQEEVDRLIEKLI